MRIIILFIASFFYINMTAQEFIETDFYKIKIPNNTTAKFFNSSAEEYAITSVYEFKQNNKPKYLFYLISNKLTDDYEPLNMYNYLSYISDMEEIEVLLVEVVNKDKIKINFKYKNDENIKGIMFLSITNNILNRFLFLLPKKELYEIFSNEINAIFFDIEYLKEKW